VNKLSFKSNRITKNYTQKYVAPPSRVFPLLCPVREHEWIDGWKSRIVYSDSGFAEEGCIFTTKLPGQEEETVWYMTERDALNHKTEIIRITPGREVVKMQISLEDNNNGGTNAHFVCMFTSLGEKENTSVHDQIGNHFLETMIWLEKSMNNYLETGNMLKMMNIRHG